MKQIFTILLLASLLPCPARAGDWPQILGPHRNGIADRENISKQFADGGPKTVWQRKVGEGLAGVAVASGRVVLFHRLGNHEVIQALDADTGKVLWSNKHLTRFVGTLSPDSGPRCVPLIHKDSIFLHGAEGRLSCVSLASGESRWSRAASKEFDAPEAYFGAGSTPIVEGDKLLVNVGGRRTAGLVAFSLTTGETIWNSTDERASYSSPVSATINGARHVIFVTRLNCVSVDPSDGEVRFRVPFGKRGPTVNAATPLIIGGHAFLSASYGIGATLLRVDEDGAHVVWNRLDLMSSQYATCVYHEGTLYGIDGRQDVGTCRLRAFDPLTGRIHWTENDFGMGTVILADDVLVIMKTDGQLVLAEASSTGYRELTRARLLDNTTRALPAVSNGKLYVRDTRILKCVDLGRVEG